jgi:selenocysteine-specific elongation factor
MHVIGTAGHVDHGKSALVAALTGMHPDRLKEEITREMSIDLGFAWMELPGHMSVGIVDVPGHRDFIENMLAGMGGLDAVLLVIAADEGIMPQTREHLAIIDLLQIESGIIVLNKIDLIDDPDWLDLVELDVHEVMKDTVLEDAPIIRVSAKTGQGLDNLREAIQAVLSSKLPHVDLGRPRLPVDRVFSLAGFGTIVTGTLLDGSFNVGDEITVLPDGLKGRIRGLQSHKQKEDKAVPGSRTAINISGLNKSEIRRGDVISHPGDYASTNLVDLHFRLLKDAQTSLKHNTEVKFFVGAAEVLAQCRVLGTNEINPGEEGFIQLRLLDPVVAVRGDRYIIRRPSPPETWGGGVILDPHPQKLHRRYNAAMLKNLAELLKGDPAEIILQNVDRLQAPTVTNLITKAGMNLKDGLELVQKMLDENSLIQLGPENSLSQQRVISQHTWHQESGLIMDSLQAFHQANPLKIGISKESLRAKTTQSILLFELITSKLSQEDLIRISGTTIALASHKIEFSDSQQKLIQEFMEKMNVSPYNPPGYKEGLEMLGDDIMRVLISEGSLFRVSEDVIFSPQAYQAMTGFVKDKLIENGTITLSELRDEFQTSRKYALAVLEHLDTIGLTIRQGDLRKLKHMN